MGQLIFMAVVTIIGLAFLINGIYGFIKGEIQVIFGRRNRAMVTFTGTACDVVASMSLLSGAAILVTSVLYWLSALTFEIGMIVAVVSLLLYQGVGFVMKLLR